RLHYLQWLQSDVAARFKANAHQMPARGAMVFEQTGIEHLWRFKRYVNSPPEVEPFVHCWRTAGIREIASPTAFDPANDDGCRRSLAQQVPNALPKMAQDLILAAAHESFRKKSDAFATVKRGNRLVEFWNIAPIARSLDADRVYDMDHQPAQDRQIVEAA